MILLYIKKSFSKFWRIIWCKGSIINLKGIWLSSTFFVDVNESLNLMSDEWFCYSLFKFSFTWSFHDKKVGRSSFGTLKYDCVIKTREMFNSLPLINNLVTTESSISLSHTLNAFVPYGFVETLSAVCNLLSSLLLSEILLIF